jgi:hypothetical protein
VPPIIFCFLLSDSDRDVFGQTDNGCIWAD